MSRKSKQKIKPRKPTAAHSTARVSPANQESGAVAFRPLESEDIPADLNERWKVLGVCLFLAAIIWAVFGQTLHYDFVNFDDNIYVYENPVVCTGLTLKGIGTVFTHVECNFYHPLTMVSLMVNHQMNGLQPGGYHLTNVLLHILSAILLFLGLRRMTGFTWRSAFVAAVFAIHPLRVESVAWVAERKDVLSGLFFLLTLWAYACYVQNTRSTVRRLAVVGLFALGLLCKPSIVTLPFVLLLLDYWPLHRFSRTTADGKPAGLRGDFSVFAGLVVEKAPLFVLSAAASVMAPLAEGKAMTSLAGMPLLVRMGNPIMSYATYLRQLVYPIDLAPFYPLSFKDFSVWKLILALVLLVAISVAALGAWRKRPYLLVGWLWFVGMLVPMIGIMQVGGFAHADRFTYLPMIGLSIALTWAAADFCAGWRYRRVVLGVGAMVILATLIFCARAQTSYWRNSKSLWTHTLACTSGNFLASNDLGHFLIMEGDVDGAIAQLQRALQIKPDYAEAHYNLGIALERKAIVNEAIGQYQAALKVRPDYAEVHYNLGNILAQTGDLDGAISHYQQALRINSDNADADNNLGNVLLEKGNLSEAIVYYQKALQINPDYVIVLNNLAWILATSADAHIRNGVDAVKYAGRACELTHYKDYTFLSTLSEAYAEAGRFDDAIATAQKARDAALAMGQKKIAAENENLMELFKSGRPFHMNNSTAP